MPISSFQFQEMLARTIRKPVQYGPQSSVTREKDLHEQIINECKNRGWFYVHSRMDLPTTTACGVTDFVIATTDGRTLWIECKRAGGKLTPAQRATIHWLERNRQHVAVVYSFQNFLTVCDMKRSEPSSAQAHYLTKKQFHES